MTNFQEIYIKNIEDILKIKISEDLKLSITQPETSLEIFYEILQKKSEELHSENIQKKLLNLQFCDDPNNKVVIIKGTIPKLVWYLVKLWCKYNSPKNGLYYLCKVDRGIYIKYKSKQSKII